MLGHGTSAVLSGRQLFTQTVICMLKQTLIRKHLACGLASVPLCLVSSLMAPAHAGLIDFESLPGGGTPTDNQELTSSYSDGATNVTFGFDTNDDFVIDLNARLENRGGADAISGYLATNHDDADQSTGGVGGDWMLREPGGVTNSAAESPIVNMGAGDDFLILYSGLLPTSAAGQIWDWDNNEAWLISAFDSSNALISEISTGINTDPNRGGTYDGRPLEFSFSGLSSAIAMIRISFTGTAANAGFAFDNFNANEATSFIPEPGPLALLMAGLMGLGYRNRVQAD